MVGRPTERSMQPPDIRLEFDVPGGPVTIRTITPEDRELEAAFVRNLSRESRYLRFHAALRELTPELLHRFIHIDFPAQMALIATTTHSGRETQIGVTRYARTAPDGDTAEVAVVVADEWQGRGVGTRLLVALRSVARSSGIARLHMRVLPENHRMIKLARRLGYEPKPSEDGWGSRALGKSLEERDTDDRG